MKGRGVIGELRWFLPVASVVALALAMADPGPARAALPPQGVYEKCPPSSRILDCGQRLKLMADAGFERVLNYEAWSGTPSQIRRYADQAAAVGVQVIWPLNAAAWRDGASLIDLYWLLGPLCLCSDNTGFKQFALGLVKNHPATWGFYVGDELAPSPQNVSQVLGLAGQTQQIAPGRPTLYVSQSGGLKRELAPFAPAADFVGADYYPVGLEPDLGRAAQVADKTEEIASREGKGTALVLQAFSWSQYKPEYAPRFPTRGELRQMRDLAISHGEPDLILWYSFNDLWESGDPHANWSNLQAAAFAPHIRIRRRSERCARGFRFRINVSAASSPSRAQVFLDGKRLLSTDRSSFLVNRRSVARGRHKLRVIATDGQGPRAKRVSAFRSCGPKGEA